jgi:putative ABC transport system permease protein
MDNILQFSSASLAPGFVVATVVVAILLAVLAWRSPHLFRIALRNVPRRRTRTILIVVGLMFATMFVATSLAIDDTISLAVQNVAVFNLGRVDEDVLGHDGPLSVYAASDGTRVADALAGNAHVAGVAPALVVPSVLVADVASRQVRGDVSAVGMTTEAAGPLATLQTLDGQPVAPGDLASNAVYLNRNSGLLLSAQVGDTVQLTSKYWIGQRASFRVQGIVTGGPLGDSPAIVLPITALQTLASTPDQINHIYVANTGNGLTGVGYSRSLAHVMRRALPRGLHVDTVKLDGVNFALNAQALFGRILTLYTLFALAIGLLLIFLIFVLLAAERRAELGMIRAVGLRRGGVALMLLFEGAAYDVAAAAIGILVGLFLGVVIISIVSPIIARLGYPVSFSLQPQSMLLAFCLGLLFTLVTIWVAAWSVSRMTVAAALRDLPEPPTAEPTLLALVRNIGQSFARFVVRPGLIFAALGAVLWGLVTRGIVPTLVGVALLAQGVARADALLFAVGLSFVALGIALLARWAALSVVQHRLRRLPADDAAIRMGRARAVADRAVAAMLGGALVLYWSLPFDALASLGLPRFSGAGIQIFFIAGVMMVAGAVWIITPNLDIALAPVRAVLGRIGRFRHVTRIALIYPAFQRFRTGIGLAMFSLVCFTMVVMACIAASTTNTYDNLPAQAANYDIVGQSLFAPVDGIAGVNAALHQNAPQSANGFAAVSSATSLLLGMLQPGAANARWQVYPAAQIDGAFLQGVGLPLVARASGFSSDAAVWQAVRDDPGSVVVDVSALSPSDAAALHATQPAQADFPQFIAPPIVASLPNFASDQPVTSDPTSSANQDAFAKIGAIFGGDPDDAFLQLQHIVMGPGMIAATPLWVGDLRSGNVAKLHIVGIVENARGQRYGLLGSPATFASVEHGLLPFGNTYYYFKDNPGVDAHRQSQILGSALFADGFETTVIQDVLLDTNGSRVFISRVLVGLVGLTLLVGMAALAVTGSRAVVERRQQIGMLRALGFRRWQVQMIFLIESLLIGVVGTVLGLVLGLILCRNIFAVQFFEPLQSGLTLVVPWGELGLICLAALAASAIAALLPAWQTGRVAPADALRYE